MSMPGEDWHGEMNTDKVNTSDLLEQISKYGPLMHALSRIATNDGYGPNGILTAEDMHKIASDALDEFYPEWKTNPLIAPKR